MMRPLIYEWPDDPYAVNCEDEYFFGDSLLVAPLLEENAESRPVYLPAGQWIDLFSKKNTMADRLFTQEGTGNYRFLSARIVRTC